MTKQDQDVDGPGQADALVTPAMAEAGVAALLAALPEEVVFWGTPGLRAVSSQVYVAMEGARVLGASRVGRALHPDAWDRFERAVDVVAKSPPQHRTKAKKVRKAKKADSISRDKK